MNKSFGSISAFRLWATLMTIALVPACGGSSGGSPGPAAPPAPTGLVASAGTALISLAWTASAGATSYNVKRSSTAGGPYTTVATGIAPANYVDSGLPNGAQRFYVVSAVNSGGESANSNVANNSTVSFSFIVDEPSTLFGSGIFSMIPGESRKMRITVTLNSGAGEPVTLSVTGALPSGVTFGFSPPTVVPTLAGVQSELTVTSSPSAPLAISGTLNVLGTGTTASDADAGWKIQVRSPKLNKPYGLAIESGGATALVTDSAVLGPGLLVRVDLATLSVIRTITSALANDPTGVQIESANTAALVLTPSGMYRVDLPSETATLVSGTLSNPKGIAIESGGATALVTDQMGGNRLARINVSTGAVVPLTSFAAEPAGIAIESGGATAIIVLRGSHDLVRVNLSSGSVDVLTSNFGDQLIGVALESGGATALTTGQGASMGIHRVQLSTGAHNSVAMTPGGLLTDIRIEAGGATALVVDNPNGRLIRVNLSYPGQSVAPNKDSTLVGPLGVALEASGTTALVTEQGGTPGLTPGRLVRVDLTSGSVTPIAVGLSQPAEIAIESGGTTALVTDRGAGTLFRINLTSGAVGTILPSFNGGVSNGVAIESGGLTALVPLYGLGIARVNLATGSYVVLSPLDKGISIAIEPGGATALVVRDAAVGGAGNGLGSLWRVNLATGAADRVAGGLMAPQNVKIESGGTTALVTDLGSPQGRGDLIRVNLSTGKFTVLARGLGMPWECSIMPGGATVIVADYSSSSLIRVNTGGSSASPTSIAQGLEVPTGFAVESGGTTALLLEYAGADPTTEGRLVRMNLSSGAFTVLYSGLNYPKRLAIEPSGTSVLVTDCGPTGSVGGCSTMGQLLRVSTSGSVSLITGGMNQPDGVAIEPGGNTAIISEVGTGSLLRVVINPSSPSFGTYQVLGPTGLGYSGDIAIEAGGTTALTFSSSGLVRVDLSTGQPTTVASGLSSLGCFAIEPGGVTALYIPESPSLYALVGSPTRINLSSGGMTILNPGLFTDGYTLRLNSLGTTGYVTQAKPTVGTLLTFPVPP